MNIKSTFKMALQSVMSNKLRTFLTMLGIIIGVFSVIVLISIGEGSSDKVRESIEQMGSNMIQVNIFDKNKKLSTEELSEIEKLEGVNKITPIHRNYVKVKYTTNSKDVSVIGANEKYIDINNYKIDYGRNINHLDIEYRNKTVIIGLKAKDDLFGEEDPIGKKISIDGIKYTVVGVLKEKKGSMYGDNNDLIIIPITTSMRQYKSNEITNLTVQAESSDMSSIAAKNIEDYLYKKHKDKKMYNVFSQDAMIESISESDKTMTMMLGGIAGISLLVGGIGIMNIMLVTVTERTKEIGIRKAIGAGRAGILVQFLIESLVISGMGGLLGVGLGIVASVAFSNAMGFKYISNVQIMIGAFAFSLLVGVFFGLYPANKASKLKPVDALRFE